MVMVIRAPDAAGNLKTEHLEHLIKGMGLELSDKERERIAKELDPKNTGQFKEDAFLDTI